MFRQIYYVIVVVVGISVSMSACAMRYGGPKQSSIQCWSGGVVVYSAIADGDIERGAYGQGWVFNHASTGDLKRVNGECVVTN